jgi:hypothetical protein
MERKTHSDPGSFAGYIFRPIYEHRLRSYSHRHELPNYISGQLHRRLPKPFMIRSRILRQNPNHNLRQSDGRRTSSAAATAESFRTPHLLLMPIRSPSDQLHVVAMPLRNWRTGALRPAGRSPKLNDLRFTQDSLQAKSETPYSLIK